MAKQADFLVDRKGLDEICVVPEKIISVYSLEKHVWADSNSAAARKSRQPELQTIREFQIDPVRPFLTDVLRQVAAPWKPGSKDNPVGQGYWIQAEFGSGKSHLLSCLAALVLGGKDAWDIIREKETKAGRGKRETLFRFWEEGLEAKSTKGKRGIFVIVKTLVGAGGGTIGLNEKGQRLSEYILDAAKEQLQAELGKNLSLYPTERLADRFLKEDLDRYPDEFDTWSGEDALLKTALAREIGFAGKVEVLTPESMGTGETVRYRAGNLDVFIFEVCDKELHKIQVKTLPDGRQVPSRPLAFIYQQHLKNIIDNEVMAIVRELQPGTKVFVVADHGFGRVGREKLWLEPAWLNQPEDCVYRNAWLRQPLADLHAPEKVRMNVIEFPVKALRMPAKQEVNDKKGGRWTKQFASIVFPKAGYAFSRPNAHFNPDAYSHGGISIQEMVIPMAVLRVREKDEGWIVLDEVTGPSEVVEGQEATFRLRLSRSGAARKAEGDIRVDVQATYAVNLEANPLEAQVVYLGGAAPSEVSYAFTPDLADATDEERKQGYMERTLTLAVIYRADRRTFRKSGSHRFVLRMNPEQVVRRVPAHLGKILGLAPKTTR